MQNNSETTPKLQRVLGLKESVALNMIDMVGIGPFVVIPLVIGLMGNNIAILAWITGAIVALADSFVWAELGAKYPLAGGSYNFLRHTFEDSKAGKYFAFLFIWQTTIQAPLVVASGSIGFAQYLAYLLPLTTFTQKLASGAVVIVLTVILYRGIKAVGKISLILWMGVAGTILWLIISGFTHFNATRFFAGFNDNTELSFPFFAGLGMATVQTIYCYLGYYNVCHLGGEIASPSKNIPRSIFLSIFGVTALYILLNISIMGVVPPEIAKTSKFIVSTFIETIFGKSIASFATIMILWIAFASLFAVILGYSRIPYAAALDGNFFKIFGKLHPKKDFPHISLLILGATAFVFSLLFKLKDVIMAILSMRILIQFIGQGIGLYLIHKREPKENFPYKMPLFPIPLVFSIILWLTVFISTGIKFIAFGIVAILSGTLVYFIREKLRKKL